MGLLFEILLNSVLFTLLVECSLVECSGRKYDGPVRVLQFSHYVQVDGTTKPAVKTYKFTKTHIGTGTFGKVYAGYDFTSKAEIAFKTAKISKKYTIDHEYEIYQKLEALIYVGAENLMNAHRFGIARVYGKGIITINNEKYAFIAMELLDGELLDYCGEFFTFKEWVELGVGMVHSISYFQSKGYVHSDIKLENYMVKIMVTKEGKRIIKVYLVDFGLAVVPNLLRECVGGTQMYLSLLEYVALSKYDAESKMYPPIRPSVDLHSFAISFVYIKFPDILWADEARKYSALMKKRPVSIAEKIELEKQTNRCMRQIYKAKGSFALYIKTEFDKANIPQSLRDLVIDTYQHGMGGSQTQDITVNDVRMRWEKENSTIRLQQLDVTFPIDDSEVEGAPLGQNLEAQGETHPIVEESINAKEQLEFMAHDGALVHEVIVDFRKLFFERPKVQLKLDNAEAKNFALELLNLKVNTAKTETSPSDSMYFSQVFEVILQQVSWGTAKNYESRVFKEAVKMKLKNWTAKVGVDANEIKVLSHPGLENGAVSTIRIRNIVSVAIVICKPAS